ncbi:MAG: hypothetical protein FIA97_14660 [Methylococcaceae bacterium]|nr:hypothetical protein [Methylococcaceae bacterium]
MPRTSAYQIVAGLCLCLLAGSLAAVPTQSTVRYAGKVFEYRITPTGENYTFEFNENPGTVDDRLKVVAQIFDTIYDDSSIPARHHYFFMKEGAKCFVYEANLYTYHACFLPNEYTQAARDRFWGFVTQMPNGWWLVSRNVIPALLVLGTSLYYLFKKQ